MITISSLTNGNAFGYDNVGALMVDRYTYNTNGNMTKDLNNGITSVSYNFLNLPRQVTRGGLTVKYVYTASGAKLKNILPGKTIEYVDGFVYEDGTLSYILTGEGRYVANGFTGTHEYNLTDHLGNVRAVIDQDGNVLQQTDYYPFGMPIARAGSSDNKYLYNGKEEQEETGWLDYGARMHDASIGRWFNVDPMAEKYHSISPYAYVGNNPITRTDPTGMDWWSTNDPSEIERLMGLLRAGEKVNTESFGDQWTHITDEEFVNNLDIFDNSRGIFEDISSVFITDGILYKNFKGYGLKPEFGWSNSLAIGGASGALLGFSNSTFRLTNGLNGKGGYQFSFKLYPRGWRGGSRALINTYQLSKLGSALGGITFGMATMIDFYGVYNHTETIEKASFNFIMGATSLYNPIFAVPYALSEAFIPGGFASVLKAYAETQMYHLEMNRKYWWYPVPMTH